MKNLAYNGMDDLMQKELRETYDTLLKACPGVHACFYLLDLPRSLLYIDPALQSALGFSTESSVQSVDWWESRIHPADKRYLLDHVRKNILDQDSDARFELFLRIRDSRDEYRCFFNQSMSIGRDTKGKIVYCIGLILDIETLHSKNEEMRVTQERLNFAFEAANDGLWDWNCTTGEVYFSHRYITMIGYDPATYPQSFDSWAKAVHPEDLEHTVKMQLAVVDSPEHGDIFECSYRFLSADGSYKHILGRGKVISRNATGRATRIVGLHTDITELHNAQERINYLAVHDPLTGLYNRFFLEENYRHLTTEDFPVSLVFVDTDGLKMINDGLGHVAGDSLLKKAAAMLRHVARNDDIISRFGGDEFVILMRKCDAEGSLRVMARLHDYGEEVNAAPDTLPVCLSTGQATIEEAAPLEQLIHLADLRMLASKEEQRAQTHQRIRKWIETRTKGSHRYQDKRL